MSEKNEDGKQGINRRSFLQIGAAGVGALITKTIHAQGKKKGTIQTSPKIMTSKPLKKLKVGFVGMGMQGAGHVRNFLNIERVEITAICDVVPEKVERMQKWVTKAGFKKPTGYSRGEYDFKRMCEKKDLDLVFTATPWNWHVPVCVAAIENGKHAATEVPAAVTID